MSKLGTEKLKAFIVGQMTDDLLTEVALTYTGEDDDCGCPDQEQTADIERQLGAKNGESIVQAVRRHLGRTSGWSRESKCRLSAMGCIDDFNLPDVAGGSPNPERVRQLEGTDEEGSCWFRMFVPKNELLGDNYRIEIITDPTDSEILCWSLVVD